MFWLTILKKIIALFNSDISPKQIAGGIALGSMIGFIPFMTLTNLVIFFIILAVNVNIGAAMFSIGIFKLIGLLTDPIAHKIGYYLLVENSSLTPLWVMLYNMPFIPFTRFNNTIVMGNIVLSIILFVPVFLTTKQLLISYRTHFRQHVQQWKIMKLFKLSSIYNIFNSMGK